ncbi:MAG: DUF3526 domain-containing protein, partial [Ferruginibacter sp.]
VLDYGVEPVEKEYQQLLSTRIKITNKLNYGSPSLLAQDILVTSAASDMSQMLAYDTAAYSYFKKWNSYLDDRIFFKENKFTKTDFESLPKYEFKPVIDFNAIFKKLILLLVWGIMPLVAGWFLLKRK